MNIPFLSTLSRFFFPNHALSTHTKTLLRREIRSSHSRHARDRIIRLDIILHRIAHSYGLTGTIGEILKQRPRIFSTHLNTLWRYHKVRNQLVHELDHPHEGELEKIADQYERILLEILR